MNEVELTSTTFASAVGVYSDFKEAINAAIGDIYQAEDNEWPFNITQGTFDTTAGTIDYTKHTSAVSIDWDSFKIARATSTANSLTQTAGVATFTSNTVHNFLTGESVTITGADQSGYNITANIIVSSATPTSFTYDVDSSTVSPATGTIIAKSNVVVQKSLTFKDLESYRKEGYADDDVNRNPSDYGRPNLVVRKTDNNIIISPNSDRVYTITYDYFTMPDDLVAYSDVPSIPEDWKETIVSLAVMHAYLFRDNVEEAQLAQASSMNDIHSMRRVLIPQWQSLTYHY